ncbi:MAG: ester cyclase [Bacteriovoracaceae bacterium]
MKIKMLAFLFLPMFVYGGVEKNKEIVVQFYELAFNKHRPVEAVKKYVSHKYVQHSPNIADGEMALLEYLKGRIQENPKSKVEIKHVIAEDDLVVLHLLSKKNKNDRGEAIIDIFKVKDSKIVEHWDVSQLVPEKTKNDNSMF